MNEPAIHDSHPGGEFTQRLRRSLAAADRRRRRRALLVRLRLILPTVLLVGPVLAWHLMHVAGSFRFAVSLLARWMLVLNVGVRVDAAILHYLGLQALPSIVGVLLLIVITAWLLAGPSEET